ncbi:ADAM family mig-17 [Mizuhopecten yessoensis]|uniref:ADAM family mig-17 n=1 Tax=Mizuhopecten yessoensis TaxID=6573 RepID=A0A210PQV1_MIZYE|nr:ADAM family mig-17 [Mizuhopecten yessoensis]
MDVAVYLVWIVYACLGFVNGGLESLSDSKYEDKTIPVDITYKHATTKGHFLHVEVTPQGGSDVISLRLFRVKRNALPPSLLVVTEDGLVEDVFSNNSIRLQSEKTFYKDEENTSAFSIDWKDGQINIMHGHFVRDGLLHSVISSDENVEGQRSPRSSGAGRSRVTLPHSMSKSTTPIDLTGDVIQFNETTVVTERRRRKRQSDGSQQLYVEYVVVTDYQNYLKWKTDIVALNMTDTEKDLTAKYNMLEFYQHVVHGMDVIFKTLSSQNLQVEIVLTGLVICNESNICPWSEKHRICSDCDTVDDKECLFEFSKWRRDVLKRLLDHDHATLFTGYDLYYKLMQSKKTVGLAYMSNMCQNGSVSLVEEKRNALSIHIAAHELGHSFGSHHDGNVVAEACPEGDKYLMAPSMLGVTDPTEASHPWWFSPCSRTAIYDYIESLDRKGLNCMMNVPGLYNPRTEDGAGLTYLPDDQCRAQYGKRSAVCREYHVDAWSSICYSMACRIPGKGECTLIYPHDGTPCANLRWCQQGNCIYSGNTRDVDELCPLGDDPNYVCTSSDCDGSVRMRAHCCQTCRHMITVAMTTSTVTTTTRDTTKTSTDTTTVTTTPHVTTIATTTPSVTTTMESTKSTLTDDDVGVITTTQQNATTYSPTDVNKSISSGTVKPIVSSTPTSHPMSSILSTPTSQISPINQSEPTQQMTPSVTMDRSDITGSTISSTNQPPRSTTGSILQTFTQPPPRTTLSTLKATIHTLPKIQTTAITNFNQTTIGTNDIENQTDKSMTTPPQTTKQRPTTVNSHATSPDLHKNTTDLVSSMPSPENSISPEPDSTTAGSSIINTESASSITTKRSPTHSTPIPTTPEIFNTSTDSTVDNFS